MEYVLLFGAALFVWWLVKRRSDPALVAAAAAREVAAAAAGDPRMLVTRRLDPNDRSTWEGTFDHEGDLYILFVNFEAMTLVQSCERGPSSTTPEMTLEYDLRRAPDGEWESRMSKRMMEALAEDSEKICEITAAAAADEPTPENLKRSENARRALAELLQSTPEWREVGRFAPRIETAYQRYIHAS